MDETSALKLLDFNRIRCQSLQRVNEILEDASEQLQNILLVLAPNTRNNNAEITCTQEVQNLIHMLDLIQSSRSHLGQSRNFTITETCAEAEGTVDGNIESQTMQRIIGNGSPRIEDQQNKTQNASYSYEKEVQNSHYYSSVHELGLHYKITEKPLDRSNNYYGDHETNDASSQTDPCSLDFFAAPAQLTTTDLSVRGRLEVWVQKSQNDPATRIEFVPYSSNSEANILQASRQPTRDTHNLSQNNIHRMYNNVHRKGKSRRILQIPTTTTVQSILRFHQDKIPDQLKESHDLVTLETFSPRTISSTSSVSDTLLNADSNTHRKQLNLRRYRFQQITTTDWKQNQWKPDMKGTRTKTDIVQKELPNGVLEDQKGYKIIFIKNLWRAKYMSDFDTDDVDWKNKINPMHIVIDELDTNKIEEFKRKIEGRLENDNRLRRRMAGVRIVVLGPFRSRAGRTRQNNNAK